MHPQLRAALLRWRDEQIEQAEQSPKLAQALANPETAWVLLTRNGKRLSHSTLAKQVKWRAARAGLYPHPPGVMVSYENKSQMSPHTLRRSFGVNMRAAGTPLEDIAEVFNHTDLNTTRNHYVFTDTPRTRKTINSYGV
jgi:site-specific recombinase XerD